MYHSSDAQSTTDDLPRGRTAISTGKGRRLGVLLLLPHHLRLDGQDGVEGPRRQIEWSNLSLSVAGFSMAQQQIPS